MTEKLLQLIDKSYHLTEKQAEGFSYAKVGPMKFTIRSFYAEGLGCVSLMKGSAMFGLMKMDTLIVNPFEKDMPLFSYDRIHAMGNDTLLLELYDTRIQRGPLSGNLKKITAEYSSIADEPAASAWYDDIKLSESLKKKGKKASTPALDELTERYFDEYVKLCIDAPACDIEAKKKAASVYTEGLLNNGGPSTDQFVKAKGREYTQEMFRKYLFGTGV
ncbi:MAG: hypothetical protein MJ137_03420 [Clostridia bacterium]|nr:hypothetical protein [Clostridia bacterium]